MVWLLGRGIFLVRLNCTEEMVLSICGRWVLLPRGHQRLCKHRVMSSLGWEVGGRAFGWSRMQGNSSALFSRQVELFFPLRRFKGKGRRRSNKSWHLLLLSFSGEPHSVPLFRGHPQNRTYASTWWLFKSIVFTLGQFSVDNPGTRRFYSLILSRSSSCSGL